MKAGKGYVMGVPFERYRVSRRLESNSALHRDVQVFLELSQSVYNVTSNSHRY